MAVAYIALVKQVETASKLDITILAPNGQPAGTYYVKQEWAVAYNNSTLTSNKLAYKILETLKSVR